MSWRPAMPLLGVLTILFGLLIYASPNPHDQLGGKIIMLYGGLIFASAFLASDRRSEIARMILIAPILLFLSYCAIKSAL